MTSIPKDRAENQHHADQQDHKIKQPTTYQNVFNNAWKNITVEPIGFLFFTPRSLCSISNENLNLEKTCLVNLGMNATVCKAMALRDKSGYTAQEEIEVQKYVSSMLSYKSVSYVLPILALIILGSWSDKTGKRKPMLMLPIFGDIIAVLGYLMCVYFFMELSMEYALFFEFVPNTMLGGYQLVLVAMCSYVASISNERSRTVRLGIVSLIGRSTITLGIALSGFMYKLLGFYGIYSIALGLYTTGLVYIMFCIREIPLTKGRTTDEDVEERKKKIDNSFWNCELILSNFRVLFRSGPSKRRKKMILIQIINIIYYSIDKAEDAILYLFVRKQFGWNEIDYSIFKTFKVAIQVAGSAFTLAIFTNYLKWDDAKLGMLAIVSKIIGSLIHGCVTNDTIFYIGAISEALNSVSVIAVKSILSKTVGEDERAQTYSMTGILENLGPVVTGPLYAMIYNRTVAYFPGTFFLVSLVINIPLFGLYYILQNIIISGKTRDNKHETFVEKTTTVTNT